MCIKKVPTTALQGKTSTGTMMERVEEKTQII